MAFNEDSRVKIPAVLHLVRLGYTYLSLKGRQWDPETNIFTDILFERIHGLNPVLSDGDVERICAELSLSLEYEDLGRAFYQVSYGERL
ncbi:hypothetical protein [Litoribacter populi]|uniref:hypothetical protein n=1 Tax=Litoribacter populi TaxID=2598460 RepID=UPI00117DBC27|nr:hypothetical protein [Litoribacter populi]